MFEISPAKNRMKEAEQALYKEISLLQKELVTPDELNRVKAQVVADVQTCSKAFLWFENT